jgi:hypothetical protein
VIVGAGPECCCGRCSSLVAPRQTGALGGDRSSTLPSCSSPGRYCLTPTERQSTNTRTTCLLVSCTSTLAAGRRESVATKRSRETTPSGASCSVGGPASAAERFHRIGRDRMQQATTTNAARMFPPGRTVPAQIGGRMESTGWKTTAPTNSGDCLASELAKQESSRSGPIGAAAHDRIRPIPSMSPATGEAAGQRPRGDAA